MNTRSDLTPLRDAALLPVDAPGAWIRAAIEALQAADDEGVAPSSSSAQVSS